MDEALCNGDVKVLSDQLNTCLLRSVCVRDEKVPLSCLLSGPTRLLSAVDSSFLTALKIAHKSPLMTTEEGRKEGRKGIGTLAGGRLPSGDPWPLLTLVPLVNTKGYLCDVRVRLH